MNADITSDPRFLRADELAQRYLGDFNERVERLGYEDDKARRLYEKAEYWLDRLNKLRTWA